MIENILYESESKEEKLYCCGYMINPANSQSDQFYHFDYAGEAGLFIIPLVYLTTENSPQYLEGFIPHSKPVLGARNYNAYGYNDTELLEQ